MTQLKQSLLSTFAELTSDSNGYERYNHYYKWVDENGIELHAVTLSDVSKNQYHIEIEYGRMTVIEILEGLAVYMPVANDELQTLDGYNSKKATELLYYNDIVEIAGNDGFMKEINTKSNGNDVMYIYLCWKQQDSAGFIEEDLMAKQGNY